MLQRLLNEQVEGQMSLESELGHAFLEDDQYMQNILKGGLSTIRFSSPELIHRLLNAVLVFLNLRNSSDTVKRIVQARIEALEACTQILWSKQKYSYHISALLSHKVLQKPLYAAMERVYGFSNATKVSLDCTIKVALELQNVIEKIADEKSYVHLTAEKVVAEKVLLQFCDYIHLLQHLQLAVREFDEALEYSLIPPKFKPFWDKVYRTENTSNGKNTENRDSSHCSASYE